MASDLRRRLRAPRKLWPTRDGLFYLLLTLIVGFGATNTGNNLLFLVLGLLLATIIVSGLLSEAVLRDVAVTSIGVRPAPAGEEGRWRLAVSKHGGRFPSFALVIEALDGPAKGARTTLLRLSPHTSEEVELRFTGQRRGRFPIERVRLSTRFPFGLAEKSRELEVPTTVTVYPRRVPPRAAPESSWVRDGAQLSAQAGPGSEPLLLRAWSPGDSLSQMHWRKSAQGRGWVASVRERESTREVRLEVDVGTTPDVEGLALLETRIEDAAAVAEESLRRGLRVELRAGDRLVPPGTGPGHRARLLEALAAIEPDLGAAR